GSHNHCTIDRIRALSPLPRHGVWVPACAGTTAEYVALEVHLMHIDMHIDPVDLEVVKASLSGIVQEMQNSLFRTGFSTIVRESQDASCALMNARGEVVAQHVVLPLHIGAFPACTAAVIDAFSGGIARGDAFLINHPYQGGSPHAPDIAVITPFFVD